ncbi:hypothetical protein QF001_000898 [Paraburkholderia youngii]|uniref:hypothetical protein n=1 Tax=Paraburkholderia youngii TaxID=2782701 RepID=UPI003D2243E0
MFPGRTVLAVKQKIAYLGKRKTRGHDSWVWDAIERELKANPGLTGRQLERKIGCCYRQVMDQLYLHTREFPKAVRVSAWVRSCPTNKSPGPWVQCWALGSEADAPKPSPMSKEDRQRRSRVAHRKPSTRRINPFATVTGLVSAPTGQPGRVYHHLVDDDREAA